MIGGCRFPKSIASSFVSIISFGSESSSSSAAFPSQSSMSTMAVSSLCVPVCEVDIARALAHSATRVTHELVGFEPGNCGSVLTLVERAFCGV